MKLVNLTEGLDALYGPEGAIRALAKAGFDGVDYSFFDVRDGGSIWWQESWRELARSVRKTAEECGVEIRQAHAPFPSSGHNEGESRWAFEAILRAMEAASIMGVKHIVVHPMMHLSHRLQPDELREENLAFYRRLIPYCEQWHIRVCAENMWLWDKKRGCIIDGPCARMEDFASLLDALNSPWITGCLDLGHCALVGFDPAECIRALGKERLSCLHVHDVDYRHDCHTLPYTRNLDWDAITAALAEIGYEGDFTFEAAEFVKPFPAELKEDALAFMAKVGKQLVEKIRNSECGMRN